MELIVFIGIQGSGKSTFYKQKFADTHLRLNLDMHCVYSGRSLRQIFKLYRQ